MKGVSQVRPGSGARLYAALRASALHHPGAIDGTNRWRDVESRGLNLSRPPLRGGRFSGVDRWPVFKCPPRQELAEIYGAQAAPPLVAPESGVGATFQLRVARR